MAPLVVAEKVPRGVCCQVFCRVDHFSVSRTIFSPNLASTSLLEQLFSKRCLNQGHSHSFRIQDVGNARRCVRYGALTVQLVDDEARWHHTVRKGLLCNIRFHIMEQQSTVLYVLRPSTFCSMPGVSLVSIE